MISRDSFRFWVGILGNVTSTGFYLSSLIKRTVEDSKPYSYLAALMNCMICFVYGLPMFHPNNTPLLFINGGGFLLEFICIAIFYKFSAGRLRITISMIFLVEVVFVIGVLACGFYGICIPGAEKRTDILGIFCIISGIVMYGSPVMIIKKVFQTKSVEHMPLYTSLIGLFNAICWTTYSLLHFDLYILVPNAMGVIFSAVQVIVFLYFKCCRTSTTPRDLESPEDTIIEPLLEESTSTTPRDIESPDDTIIEPLQEESTSSTPRDIKSPDDTIIEPLQEKSTSSTPRDIKSRGGSKILVRVGH